MSRAAAAASRLHPVFACSNGDPETLEHVLSALVLTGRPVVSPASFWSLMTRSDAPSTSLGAYDRSFAAGLLEAVTQVMGGAPVLLVTCDVPPPSPLAGLMGEGRSAVYRCRVESEGRMLAEARLTLVFRERAAG